MKEKVQIRVEFIEPAKLHDNEIGLVALVRVNYCLPTQNQRVVDVIEVMSDESGQYLKRELFRQGIEIADRELVISMRAGKAGKGIQLFGTRRYSFKTCFGTVVVKRIRIRHKSDGSTEVPSARIWGTPQQVMVSRGLKKAVCNIVIKESFASTRQQIARETGEAGIVSKSTIGNILHGEGGRLALAQQARAEQVYQADESAKLMLGGAGAHIAEDYFEAIYLPGEELQSEQDAERLYEQINWEPTAEIIKPREKAGEPDTRAAATEQIIVQMDEVVVNKQPGGKRERIVHYNGTVKSEARTFYCSGRSYTQLISQVGAVLAQLGVASGNKQILVLSDCANWITNWARGIGIIDKQAYMCWWHLRDRVRELAGEAFTNKVDRDVVKRTLLKSLWRGQADKALSYVKQLIIDVEDGISQLSVKGISELNAIRNYLIKRYRYLPNYQARRKNKEWIASTQIEKFNDLAISARCKGQGRRWSRAGVIAIAALATAARNGELNDWQQNQKLPALLRAA